MTSVRLMLVAVVVLTGAGQAGAQVRLDAQLQSKDATERVDIARQFARTSDPATVRWFRYIILHDPASAVRKSAARSLGEEHDPDSAELLRHVAQHDPDPLVRKAAVVALDRCLLDSLPEFRAAKRTRLTGILVASAGSGGGALFGGIAMLLAGSCGAKREMLEICEVRGARTFGIGAFIVAGVLAVTGVAIAVAGQARVTRIRNRVRTSFLSGLTVDAHQGGGSVGAAWTF